MSVTPALAWMPALVRVAVTLGDPARIDRRDAYQAHRFTRDALARAIPGAGYELKRRLVIVDYVRRVAPLVMVGRARA